MHPVWHAEPLVKKRPSAFMRAVDAGNGHRNKQNDPGRIETESMTKQADRCIAAYGTGR
jgi:hypothetical protein